MKVRKLISSMLSISLLVSILAGCGNGGGTNAGSSAKDGSSAPAAKPVVLKFWGGVPPESGYQEMCDNFNEEFKDQNISVEYERYVNDETGNIKLDTTLLAGSDIDVFMTYGQSYLVKRQEGNMAQELTSFIEKDQYDMVGNYGEFSKTTYINDKPFALPTTLTQNALLVNKDMFDEAGIEVPKEWTLDELREIAKKLTHGEGADKVYGMYWNTGAIMGDLTPTKLALGGDFMYKEGGKETNLDHPFFLKNVSVINDMMNVDQSCPTHVDSVTQKLTIEGLFLSGKTAITIGSWAVRNIKNREEFPHDFVTAAVPYPTIEGESNYSNGEFGDLLCMNTKSKNKNAAWDFMKWYAEKGMLPVVSGGRVPSNKNFNLDDVSGAFLKGAEDLFEAESIKQVLIAPKEKYPVQTQLNKLPEINKIVNEELEAIYTGQKTPEEGLASAKQRGDEQLQK